MLDRTILSILLALVASGSIAQGMHVHHAFANACNGYMYYDESVDSVVWSTGHVGPTLDDLPPGSYGFTAYQNGVVVNEGVREVELVEWSIGFSADPSLYANAFFMSGTLEVPHCVSQIFSGVCCMPDPEQTVLTVFQDGEPYSLTEVPGIELDQIGECAGCVQLECAWWVYMFIAPAGHVYTLGLNDPVCQGLVMLDTVFVAHSCENLQLVTEVADANGGQANGSVTFVEAIPDPSEPYPIEAPVSGTASLYRMEDGHLEGYFQNAVSAQWEGLSEGAYLLTFTPDAACPMQSTIIQVGTTTSIDGPADRSSLGLFPTVTDGPIQLVSSSMDPVHLRIIDAQGRVVRNESRVPGSFFVDDLATGVHILIAEQGPNRLRARFIKR